MTGTLPATKWNKFDVARSLFALIKKDLGLDRISAQTPILHDALFKLSQEYPELLGEFNFDQRGDFPYSHEFNGQLVAQEMAGHLSCLSPDFVTYLILPKAMTNFEKYHAKLFSPEEHEVLAKMAKRFSELLKP